MLFMCGCTLAKKLAYGYTPVFVGGRQVCPEHYEPERGYLTAEAIKKGILSVPQGT